MFDFKATIDIHTTAAKLWDYLIDIEEWWLPSNPEHIELEILSQDKQIDEGTRIFIREKIAGIPGEIVGEVQEVTEPRRVQWQSDRAEYRFFGIPLSIKEGVTWQIEPLPQGVELSAHVWAEFPRTWMGKSLEWIFKHVLNGVQIDCEHAKTELRFLKTQMEH